MCLALALIFLDLIMCQEKILKKAGKGVTHKIQQLEDQKQQLEYQKQQLEDQNEALRDELSQEREKNQKIQEVLSREQKKRICECKICYQQPDQWVMLSCGHMFCKPCADRVQLQIPKRCPNCRASIRGCFDCLPFAG